MSARESAGVTRRTLIAAAWSAPVIAATAAVPLAAASAPSELTAWLATSCGAPDRATLYLRNDTTGVLPTFLELTADGEPPSAGPGPVLEPGETRPFGFGLLPNGGYTVRASTEAGVRFDQRLVLDCPSLGLTARLEHTTTDGTPSLLVHVRNDTDTRMEVFVDFDLDEDGTPESRDTVLLEPGEERALPYGYPASDFTVRVSNAAGFALIESFAAA